MLLVALAFGCARQPSATSAPQILRISQRNEPADLDPATATLPDEFYVIGALGEGLLIPNPKGGDPLPGAAKRYEVSADGLVYTFHLRADAVWSNGEPITADDFIASYRRILMPSTAAPKADLFFAVKNAHAFATGAITDFSAVGFRAIDPLTLAITLEQPALRFPHYVASGPWIPANPRAIAQHGRQWTQPDKFVGNGLFVLSEWRPQQRIVVKKNQRHHAAAAVKLDEIDFVRFDSGETEERAFRAGQIDVTVAIPTTKIAVYAREHSAELHRAPTAETRYLSFNLRRPALSDARVRRALTLAIDRRRIVERITLGGQEPAWRFLPPQLRAPSAAALVSPLRDDFAEAKRLLAEAGFPDGKNFPRLELTAWSPSQTPVLEALQAMWREALGINVSVAIREAKVHLTALATGDYDIAFATTLALLDVEDPAALFATFSTNAPDNFSHWSDAAFDRLVADALIARDPVAQSTQLLGAEKLLLDSAPVAPIYFNSRTWLMSPRVRGWQEDSLWRRSYLDLEVVENGAK
jgi:oligopeptide transport system substrate-binding protein